MQIHNTFIVSAPLQDVWDFLFDIERMGLCVPGVESIDKIDETHYSGVIQIQVGPVKARFEGKVELLKIEPPCQLTGLIHARDRLTASLIDASFKSELAEIEAHGSQITYDVDLTVRGRLGQFGSAVIHETAIRLTQEFAACLQRQLEPSEIEDHPAVKPGTETGPGGKHSSSPSLIVIVTQAFLTVIRQQLMKLIRWQH